MYSLRTREKVLEAQAENASGRAKLWRNLGDKKKSGRMVRRIYNKTREEMVESCRSRCRAWVSRAAGDMGEWVREPQPSVHDHTFRDRHPEAELGPANGHISARKYIPRLAFGGGGELDKAKTADLQETFAIPSRMRGNNPTALHNPCRPTVMIDDTAKIHGRVEHPHWEAPRYFLRPREKAKEIGPDVQYADRNDMQRIFAGVVRDSLFPWGKYEGRGPYDIPSCRNENSNKWMGDAPFNPGYKFRDNQRESMAGVKSPKTLLIEDGYRRRGDFERQRYPEKELPRHERFRLVVKNGEYACPEGITRRRLRYEEEPPEPYPEGKMFFTSLRSVPFTTSRQPNTEPNIRSSVSLGSLHAARFGMGGSVDNTRVASKGFSEGSWDRGGHNTTDGQANRSLKNASSSPEIRSPPGNHTSSSVRFSPEGNIDSDSNLEMGLVSTAADVEKENMEDSPHVNQGEVERMRSEALREAQEREAIVASGMRRGSEVATWAICGTPAKSSRDYLW